MASTATSRLRLNKQGTYDNPETWGIELNNGMIDMVDSAFGGFSATISGDVALTVENYTADQARQLFMILDGAGGFTITVPAVDKLYYVVNDCADDVTITPLAGTGAVVRAGTAMWWYCDGTDGFVKDPTLDQILPAAADVSMGGNKITDLAPAVADTDAINKGQAVALTEPYAIAAADSAAAALVSEGNAAASEGNAATSENNAAASEAKSQEWAINPVDDPVETSPNRYSALHHATKAAEWASGLNLPPLVVGDAGKALIVNDTGTGYDTRPLASSLPRSARTSNTVLGLLDISSFIDVTSGTFTQTIAAAATLGNGWWCYYRNSGTGTVTLDPNGSETVNGATTYNVYPGQTFALICDGSNFIAILVSGAQEFVARDEKTSGTAGGTIATGSWVTRTINTVKTNTIPGASLASNQVTLPAGTYEIEIEVPGAGVGSHRSRLYNVTDSAVVELGSSEYAPTSNVPSTKSRTLSIVTITSPKAFRLEHRTTSTSGTLDGGFASEFSVAEVYSTFKAKKVG